MQQACSKYVEKKPENLYQKILFKQLEKVTIGKINISSPNGDFEFGNIDSHLKCRITIHTTKSYKKIVLGGSIGAAESYMDGLWDCNDLTALFLIFIKNYTVMDAVESFFYSIGSFFNKLKNRKYKNTIKQSTKNISHHYDLSNDFYKLFLDDQMMYSSAYFKESAMTLEQASIAKLERICEKLNLQPSDHVLEIGSGWGGFAIFAAQKYKCRVTTITISKQQFDYAQKVIKELKLENNITLLFQDYRHMQGIFDKLVSIEMVEAVGAEFLPIYFKQCAKLLKPGGLCLFQAITIADKFYPKYKNEVDFIQKYIFPGGCLPSMNEILNNTAKHSSLQLIDAFSFGNDYSKTIDIWNERVNQNIHEIQALGFDDRFLRMWHYYLMYCKAGFLQNHINVFQLLFEKADHF